MKGKIFIPDLDFEYKLWKNRLRFYQQECRIFIARLLSQKGKIGQAGDDILERLNGFIDAAQRLENDIREREEEISYYSKDYPISTIHQHYQDHEQLKGRVQQASKSHLELVIETTRQLGDILYV